MKNKTRIYDGVWVAALLVWALILIIPASRAVFESLTAQFRYAGSFVKFAILSTMGELLGLRIVRGAWVKPAAIAVRVVIWGFVGMAIALVFTVYNGGVMSAQAAAYLPLGGSALATALFTSAIMNVTFGPMLFAVHKLCDTYLDLKFGLKKRAGLDDILSVFDWNTLVKFTWLKCCLLFWIPAHTLVFLLPPNFRIIASAFLSIALGLIGAYGKKNQLATQK